MEEIIIIIWGLSKYGKKRGYGLSPKERKEQIPYSDKIMKIKWRKWLKEKKQEGEW